MEKTTTEAAVATIGIDLAKKVFQVHAVDSFGKVVIRRTVKRRELVPFAAKLPPCVIGMEACATAHHWARELARLVHEVKLIPPAYVKAYVRRQKNDMADAAAICEAVTRPMMRAVFGVRVGFLGASVAFLLARAMSAAGRCPQARA